jgi:hypothetical protein
MPIFKAGIFASAAERVVARCLVGSMTGSRPSAYLATQTWLSSKTIILRVPGLRFTTMSKTCREFEGLTIKSLPCVFSKDAAPEGPRDKSQVDATVQLVMADEQRVVLAYYVSPTGQWTQKAIVAPSLSMPPVALEGFFKNATGFATGFPR